MKATLADAAMRTLLPVNTQEEPVGQKTHTSLLVSSKTPERDLPPSPNWILRLLVEL